MPRYRLLIEYDGAPFSGWQVQDNAPSVQGALEDAVMAICGEKVRVHGAGRTDAGVHALMQVVHFDTDIERAAFSWVRGTNRYLPADIALQWAHPVPDAFHCRASALARRYRYELSQSPVRPSLDAGRVGWSMRPLDGDAMRAAAALLIGTHDFSSFRASACQARSPVKQLRRIDIARLDVSADGERCRWQFEFEADAFLHHMIRNLMGCLLRVGQGDAPPGWIAEVLAARSRKVAAPTFSADGLYFLGPLYDAAWGLPAEATHGG